MRFFLIITVIVAIFALLACGRVQKKEQQVTMMNCLLKDETPNGKRVIMTRQMNIAEIENAIVGFIKLNEENGSSIARPKVKPKDNDTFLISFPTSTTYDLFCYWVNYFVYSNREKRYNNHVTGWYEVGAEAKGVWTPFANQTWMFYIPATDTGYDNVYITTESGTCYKQEFSQKARLIQQKTVYRDYSDMP
jgi:hypothetical protein